MQIFNKFLLFNKHLAEFGNAVKHPKSLFIKDLQGLGYLFGVSK